MGKNFKPYGKIIRDNIPGMMDADPMVLGYEIIEIKDKKEKEKLLRKKLQEEVQEYLVDPCTEELADILSVVKALAVLHYEVDSERVDLAFSLLDGDEHDKTSRHGGFHKAYFLAYVIEEDEYHD